MGKKTERPTKKIRKTEAKSKPKPVRLVIQDGQLGSTSNIGDSNNGKMGK